MFRRLSRLPRVYYVGTSVLIVVLIAGGVMQDAERSWPLGLTTLLGTAAVLGIAALYKRLELGPPPKPFDPAHPTHRSTLTGRVVSDGRTIRSPYTGTEYVALGLALRLTTRGVWMTLRAVPFRVRLEDGSSVAISLPAHRTHYYQGRQTRLGTTEVSQETREYWKKAWPLLFGEPFEQDSLAVAYEYGFQEQDPITIIGSFVPKQASDGSVVYEPKHVRGHPEVVFASMAPEQVRRLQRAEVNLMLLVIVPMLLLLEISLL